MYRFDRLCMLGDLCFDLIYIQIERVRFDIDKNRCSAKTGDRANGSEETVRRCDYLIARACIVCHQGQQQCVASRSTTDRMFGTAVSCQLVLQRFDFRAEYESIRVKDPCERGLDLRAQG